MTVGNLTQLDGGAIAATKAASERLATSSQQAWQEKAEELAHALLGVVVAGCYRGW
ncbi:hypothetical protein NMX13_10820 [Dickeya zeae]|nr:hypothetical protein NMX13_10820 [Dickeya zeae]